MQTPLAPTTAISDTDLIAELTRLVACEREATGRMLRSMMEVDARRLYLGLGYSSLFGYCTEALHYAEHAALNRIEVARGARRFPSLLVHIDAGTLNLTGARLLGPHLTAENADGLLAAARHKSKREIEEMIAAIKPQPAAPPTVRKLPSARQTPPKATATAPRQPPDPANDAAPAGPVARVTPPVTAQALVPLSPERYKVQFTITRDTRDRLRQVQDLMRHVNPNGDIALIFERALTLLLADLQRTRCAASSSPRVPRAPGTTSRHIPAEVKRAVWQRDDGRCAFAGAHGVCGERAFLEFHHVVPFAAGGRPTVANIELRCRAHNAYEASLFFAEDGGGCLRERRN